MSSAQMENVRVLRDFHEALNGRQLEFLTPVPDVLVCDLCGVVTRSPTLTRCRHFYCDGCVYRIPNGKPRKCPMDGVELDRSTTQRLPAAMSDDLNKCRVRCPNAAHGCTHDTILAKMPGHFPNCQFFPIPCIKCGVTVPYNNIVNHRVHSCEFSLNNAEESAQNKM